MADPKRGPGRAVAALWCIAVLAAAGSLFSGYLTVYTFVSGQPGCEVFILGMPSCFYGTLMYAAVFVLALGLSARRRTRSGVGVVMAAFSAFGIAFAAYLTETALAAVSCTKFEILGLPPCVYGLFMYLVLLALALFAALRR